MLIAEALKRGMECFFYEARDLAWHAGEITAPLAPIVTDTASPIGFRLGDAKRQSLRDMDVVWMRQDPPFDMAYITATHLLEHLLPHVKVVNHPAGVRNAPEKLSALAYGEYMPPTLISSDAAAIHNFARTHGSVVAKPLYGYGGHGVFQFGAGDPNIDTLLEQQRLASAEPLMWQAFLPEVKTKDMRVLLIAGEVAGYFYRIPAPDSIRANMRAGGTPQSAQTLSSRQTDVCERLKPWLLDQGLLLAGLDFIGDYLTEINVTSPTGLRVIEQLEGRNLARMLWDQVAA